MLVGGGGERKTLRLVAQHADASNLICQGPESLDEVAHKLGVLDARCADVGRDPAEITVSKQTTVVIGETEADAQDNLAKAAKVYGGHLGAGIEAHGIWGDPERFRETYWSRFQGRYFAGDGAKLDDEPHGVKGAD